MAQSQRTNSDVEPLEIGGRARLRIILELDLDPKAAEAGAEFVINEAIQWLVGEELFSSPAGWAQIVQVEAEACAVTR